MVAASKRHGLALGDFCLALQRFLRSNENLAALAGLNSVEHDLLLALSAYPGGTCSSIAVLSERLLTQHHVAAGSVTKLAQKGLLTSERNTRDQRALILTLTPKGKSLLNDIASRSLAELGTQGARLIDSLTTIIQGGKRRAI